MTKYTIPKPRLMITIMMTSAVRVRKCERRGSIGGTGGGWGGGHSPWCGFPTQAVMQLQRGYTSLTTSFIMEGGGCEDARSEPAEFTPSASHSAFHFSGRQREAQLPTLSAPTSVRHLAPLFFAPLSVGGAVAPNWFRPVGLSHTRSPARTWMGGRGDVKESIWMNKWCRPAAKKKEEERRRLAEEASLKMHPCERLCPT